MSIRSELLELSTDERQPDTHQGLPATFVKTVYLGLTSSSLVRLADGREIVVRSLSDAYDEGLQARQPVIVRWRTRDARLHLS